MRKVLDLKLIDLRTAFQESALATLAFERNKMELTNSNAKKRVLETNCQTFFDTLAGHSCVTLKQKLLSALHLYYHVACLEATAPRSCFPQDI